MADQGGALELVLLDEVLDILGKSSVVMLRIMGRVAVVPEILWDRVS